jgi:DNA repair protein RecO (recombination protein O)
MYVAEMLDALTADADPQPELFDVASTTLLQLSGLEGPDALVWPRVIRFELAALRATGQAPSLGRCAECRAAVPDTGRIAFGMLDGGVLCPECRRGRRVVVSVSSAALAVLRSLRAGSVEKPIDPPVLGELRAVMNTYVAHVLGRKSRLSPRLVPVIPPRSTPPRDA